LTIHGWGFTVRHCDGLIDLVWKKRNVNVRREIMQEGRKKGKDVLLIMQIRYFERYFAKKDILPLDDS
jgi:hypothetical protein